ncbi:MAG: tRNA (guanosine(46)-N7)-methyltransferase TrmB [Eubacteriales bacterium]
MRQRKLKNIDDRLLEKSKHLVINPKEYKGKWNGLFGNDKPIYMEVGCGKGKFITSLATMHPENNYIGVEGQGSVLLRALERLDNLEIENLFLIREFIRDIEEYFAEGELSGIFLNFSDPWPKDRHAKRRLTHSNYLNGYKNILKPESFIEFKTDNDELFEFGVEEFINSGFEIIEKSEDLHNSSISAKEVTTEYEDKFKDIGRTIKYCKAKVK